MACGPSAVAEKARFCSIDNVVARMTDLCTDAAGARAAGQATGVAQVPVLLHKVGTGGGKCAARGGCVLLRGEGVRQGNANEALGIGVGGRRL